MQKQLKNLSHLCSHKGLLLVTSLLKIGFSVLFLVFSNSYNENLITLVWTINEPKLLGMAARWKSAFEK